MQISMDSGLHSNHMLLLDTLAISKRLQSAGTPVKQAEAQAEVFAEIMTQNLATKTDVENIRKDIENTRKDIEILRKDTNSSIENLRKDTNSSIENLRKDTNTNIENLRKDTNTNIENLRKETKTDIENLRKDLIIEIGKTNITILKWIIPLMVGQLMAAAGLMKMFIN